MKQLLPSCNQLCFHHLEKELFFTSIILTVAHQCNRQPAFTHNRFNESGEI
ncbi:MAG: hypothetical protein ACI358_06475 [Candidatus Limimorpha sp.]